MSEPVYISDLSQCQPPEAISSVAKPGHWRAVAYETDRVSGTMLIAGAETAAPEIVCPLEVSGWHGVHFGVFADYNQPIEFLARLTDEETFSMPKMPQLQPQRQDGVLVTPAYRTKQIHELFWKAADLSGQDLVLGQRAVRVSDGDSIGSHQCPTARIAYVKLVPLDEQEVSDLEADIARTDTKRLFAHNDAHGVHYFFRPTTPEEVRRHIEPFRDSDFSRLYWEAGAGDGLQYFTRIGRPVTLDGMEDFGTSGYRFMSESWRIFRDMNIDPFQVALDYSHDVGLEFHAAYRVAGFHFPPPHEHFNHGDSFYKRHPELRGTDRDGRVTPRISYSYTESRRYVISILREIASYDVDGIALLYNRRPPLVDYEPPLVEGFKREYGEDPRGLPENDLRWLAYRARTLTEFMREVREAMDAAEAKKGRNRRIDITAVVMSNEEENLFNAIDVRAWVKEGLVDTLVPYSSVPGLDSLNESWTDPGDADFWLQLTAGTSCKLSLNIMPREMPPDAYYRIADQLYQAGVEHLFFWDCDARRNDYSPSWNALRRLGHRGEIEAWAASGEPSLTPPPVAISKLGDWDTRYVTPG